MITPSERRKKRVRAIEIETFCAWQRERIKSKLKLFGGRVVQVDDEGDLVVTTYPKRSDNANH